MERPFEKIAFGWLGYTTIPVQVTEPFSVLWIRKMGIGPFAYLAVALEIPVEEVESYIFSALGRME